MADLVISRVSPGVARVRSTDPFDTLEIHRIERSQWQSTPAKPGVYLLHGVSPQGKLTVYVGMSTRNMRSRIRSHHVDPGKNWFGVLFAIPVTSPVLCPAIEAELIVELVEAAAVDVIEKKNVVTESPMLGSEDVHVVPAVEKIGDALQLILGTDIFGSPDIAGPAKLDEPFKKLAPLAREYKGRAQTIRPREPGDLTEATHRWVSLGLNAWGRFEGEKPDKRFRVLRDSEWRRAKPNPDAANFAALGRVHQEQDKLVSKHVLDDEADPPRCARDHTFENWSTAARIVAGRAASSGAWRWQRLG